MQEFEQDLGRFWPAGCTDQTAADRAGLGLYVALELGEQMLSVGAEISRVEDSIRRICLAYGVERVDVFTITSSIVVTIYGSAFGAITQTRRIRSPLQQDMTRLDLLNRLSRDICAGHMEPDWIRARLEDIRRSPQYSFPARVLIYALISSVFSLFFGGAWQDALVSAGIGAVLCVVGRGVQSVQLNNFLAALISSCVGGLLALIAVKLGLGLSADKISIGNIMLLIPGIALTTAVRDMFGGDTISGVLRFCEAVLLSMTVAFGFVLTLRMGAML